MFSAGFGGGTGDSCTNAGFGGIEGATSLLLASLAASYLSRLGHTSS